MPILERDDTYFPIKIRIIATGEEMIVNSPQALPQGVAFKIITVTAPTAANEIKDDN